MTSGVHVEDAARAYVLALKHAPAGSIYNITTANDITNRCFRNYVIPSLILEDPTQNPEIKISILANIKDPIIGWLCGGCSPSALGSSIRSWLGCWLPSTGSPQFCQIIWDNLLLYQQHPN